MTADKVTAGDIVSATVKYSNQDDASREFDIFANVSITGKDVSSIDGGIVNNKGGNISVATFNCGADANNYCNIYFTNVKSEKAQQITGAIYSFVKDVLENVKSKNE